MENMNREIKFEVLIKHKVSGNTFKDVYTLDELLERNGSLFNKGIQEIVYKRQYTGLKDKNGVEIYEGDYLFCPMDDEDFFGCVGFKDGTFCLLNKNDEPIKLWDDGNFEHISIELLHLPDSEILSNRFETPQFKKP